MLTLSRLAARLRGLLRRRRAEAEFDDELQFHLDRAIEANRARGLSPPDARRAAIRDLGGLAQVAEAVRDVRATRIESVWRDLRYAARTLVAAPALTSVLVVTLGLGIGANTAMFSVLYGLLIRPLPYRDADRLALVRRAANVTGAHSPVPEPFFGAADIQAWRDQMHAFEASALYSNEVVALQSAQGGDLLDSAVVSDAFFSVVGGATSAGRPLGSADNLASSVVIGEALARRLFGEPGTAVGQPLTLSSRPYTIVGVAARSFQFPTPRTEVWMPAGVARSLNARCCGFRMIGRLRPHATIQQASAEASALAPRLHALIPSAPAGLRATVVSLRDQIVEPVRQALLVLFAATALVLLAACANAGNLLFARQIGRGREQAIRLALGASRGRLVRHTLLESLLLAAAGTTAGLVLATVIVRLAGDAAAVGLPPFDGVHIDGIALLFSVALTGAVAIGTAVAPALRCQPPADALRAGPAGASASPGARRLSRGLCVAQLASSLILLVGAVLLGRSYLDLVHTDLGVRTDHVVTMSLNLAFNGRPSDAETVARVQRVLDRVRSLPKVQVAGVGTAMPPAASRLRVTLRREGETVDYQASIVAATPGYFEALGMRLVNGRLFTPADAADRAPVMIMSVDTARRFFGDGDPIGRHLPLPGLRDGAKTHETMTLVGTVANVKYSGLEAVADDAVYRPFAQQTWVAPFLVARTTDDPERLVPIVRQAIAAVDRDVVISQAGTLDDVLSEATAPPRVRTALLAAMAGLVLLMAAIGLYGVMAQAVSLRTREMGIRMALGARSPDLLAIVLREAGRITLFGLLSGFAVAVLLSRALRSLLYGVAPTDPASFAIAGALLTVVALAASYVPARRAAKVDPLVVLRGD